MKKYLLPILLLLMFIPLVVNAETCDTDKISISSIAIESKSDNVEELSEATVSGKSINLDLSMSNVGDYIEYELVVKNDSNEDYELDKTGLKLNSDYIDYSFETEDDSNIIKAKSTKTIYLKAEYKNEVPDDKFTSNTYNDNKTMVVNLSSDNPVITNPNTKTQSYITLIVLLLLLSITTYIVLKKNKKKFMILIIGATIIIPVYVYALCKCEINIDSKIEITKLNNFCFIYTGDPWTKIPIPYYDNESMEDYINRSDDVPDLLLEEYTMGILGVMPASCFTFDENNNVTVDWDCFNNNVITYSYDNDDELFNESEACYLYID